MNEIEAINFKLSRAKNLTDVADCCKDWRDVLTRRIKLTLRPYQIPLSDRMIEMHLAEGALGNEIASLWARQSGKTEDVADTTLVIGTFNLIFLRRDFSCGLFAPVESMITHVTRNRLRKRFKVVKPWLERYAGLEQTAGEGYTSANFTLHSLINDSEMNVRSLSAGESASIIGETFDMLVVEQSELVDALKLKTDIFPMAAAKNGLRVMTGTTSPYFKNEYFRLAVEKYNKDPLKNQSTADWMEIVDWRQAAKASSAYARYVKQEKDKLGEDSIEFKTQYNLEWIGTALKFVGWEVLAVLERDYDSLPERLRFFGIDVARAGDSTVVTVIELDGGEMHILGWLELEGLNFEYLQVPAIVDFLKDYAPLRFGLIDSAGMGKIAYDMLKRRLWYPPEGERYKDWSTPWARLDDFAPTQDTNDDMFKALDREVVHKRLFYPKIVKVQTSNYQPRGLGDTPSQARLVEQMKFKARFIEQMLDLERKYVGYKLKLEAPKIRGRHDDYPMSLALAVYALKERAFHAGVTSLEL
jgi:hypothetical protein